MILHQLTHNFGRADELDRDSLVRLCRSISRVCGLEVVDPIGESRVVLDTPVGLPFDFKLHRTFDYGVPLMTESFWERLGIGKLLRSFLKNDTLRALCDRALLVMVANRLCEPDSKLGAWDRWLSTVYMPSCRGLNATNVWGDGVKGTGQPLNWDKIEKMLSTSFLIALLPPTSFDTL